MHGGAAASEDLGGMPTVSHRSQNGRRGGKRRISVFPGKFQPVAGTFPQARHSFALTSWNKGKRYPI
jgi:hypothetical protein